MTQLVYSSCCGLFWPIYLGPIVQSIVSLTKSLRCQLVKYMPFKLSNTPIFFVETSSPKGNDRSPESQHVITRMKKIQTKMKALEC